MLSPDDRSALLAALRPPPGTVLGQAVGTTFTLDLEAAMGVPLAFARSRVHDLSDPLAVMEALRDCRERIDIFCQAGAITPPRSPSTLFAFLEPMITQVWPRGRLFHPKIWLLRYDGPDGSRMRLLVLTRNLTTDRAWDLAVSLDGEVRPGGQRDEAVPALIGWALRHVTGPGLERSRLDRLRRLVEDAACTTWKRPDDVWELTLHALGVGQPPLDLSGTRALVVSPFVEPDGLAMVDARTRTLVCRSEELDRLDPAAVEQVDVHVLDEAAGLSEGSEDDRLTGLHAKAYVIEFDRRARVIIGSPNATRPGLAGDARANVEFAVTLEGSRATFGVDRWLSKDSLGHLLVDYERHPPAPEDETLPRLEATLRGLAGTAFFARAVPDGQGWTEVVWPEGRVQHRPGQLLRVELLTGRGRRQDLDPALSEPVRFAALTAAEVTPFLILTVEQDGQSASSCVRATMVDDVPDRLDHVLLGQVDTAEKFLRWLLMLLAEDPGADVLAAGPSSLTGAGWLARAAERGLFESIVTCLADHPEQLTLVERLVTRVVEGPNDTQVLPDGFLELWQVVRKALAQRSAA